MFLCLFGELSEGGKEGGGGGGGERKRRKKRAGERGGERGRESERGKEIINGNRQKRKAKRTILCTDKYGGPETEGKHLKRGRDKIAR